MVSLADQLELRTPPLRGSLSLFGQIFRGHRCSPSRVRRAAVNRHRGIVRAMFVGLVEIALARTGQT